MSKILKRKSMMVLFEIESSIGNFILSKSDFIINNVEEYYCNKEKLDNDIESGYLDDLLKIMLKMYDGSIYEEDVKKIYNNFKNLDIFSIRNVLAHPNRTFLSVYWYKVAVLASDPLFEKLGIESIKDALYSAENNQIIDPPDGWAESVLWDIPNNLPDKSDYSITGLVGRTRETVEIKNKLKMPRNSTLAIVAPGGVGKTSVALDLLRSIVTDQDSVSWIDGVLYTTLKNEGWNGNFISEFSEYTIR